jgi:hypothetical protein
MYKVHVPAIGRWYPDTPFESEARQIQVIEPETVHHIDLQGTLNDECQLPPETSGTVQGLIRVDFALVPRVRILIWNESDTVSASITSGPGYTVPCVPPGEYRAALLPNGFYRTQYHPGVNDPDSSIAFTVSRGDTTRRIDFDPDRSVLLDGFVRDRETTLPVAGVPIRAFLQEPPIRLATLTQADGSFRFDLLADSTGLPAGGWTLATDSIAITPSSVVPIRTVRLWPALVPEGVRLDFEIPEIQIEGWSLERDDGRIVATSAVAPGGTRTRSVIDPEADGSARYRLTIDLGPGAGWIQSDWTDPVVSRAHTRRLGPIPWDGVRPLTLIPPPAEGPAGSTAELYSLAGSRVTHLRITNGRIEPPIAPRLASGVYFLRFRAATGRPETARIVITR